MSEKNMPGVMVYFDIRPTVDTLTDAEAGQLLRAILHYGEQKTPVSFPDNRVLQVVWNSLETQIDRDRKKYERKVEIQRRNARKRWDAMACQAMPTMPTTTTTPTPTTTPTTTTTATPTATPTTTTTTTPTDISLPSFPPPGRAREELWAETRAKAEEIRALRLAQERQGQGKP